MQYIGSTCINRDYGLLEGGFGWFFDELVQRCEGVGKAERDYGRARVCDWCLVRFFGAKKVYISLSLFCSAKKVTKKGGRKRIAPPLFLRLGCTRGLKNILGI